jgi:ribonuclease P protein component
MKNKISSLSKSEDFRNILKGKKFANKYLTIFFTKLINKNNNKLNISFVAKKKLGSAVKRNKIKRRLRNIMNEVIKKTNINFNYSYLVIAKKTVLSDEYIIIKQTLLSDFERIK